MDRFMGVIVLFICLACAASPVVSAADANAASTTGSGSATNTTGSGSASSDTLSDSAGKTLQGSVKTVDVEAAETLRQMGDAAKKMQRAMLELMGEATRQDYIAVGDPNIIGTLIIPSLPDNMKAVGPYLPIRKKWADYYLNQVGDLIPIYAEMVDSLVMPQDTKTQATILLDQMRPLFHDAKEHYDALVGMSHDFKKVHNSRVAIFAVDVHDDMEKIDKLRMDVFKLLKNSEDQHKQ